MTGPFTKSVIAEHVKGLSFVDIGGLWNTVNEMVTVASAAGAASLAMADMQPPGNHWWQKFEQRAKDAGLGTGSYACHHVDLDNPNVDDQIGTFDFVHCAGILYHVPSPIYTMMRLRSITKKYLVLGSMVMPESVENEQGEMHFSGGECIFIPALAPRTKEILRAHFERLNVRVMHIVDRPDTEPFWVGGAPNYGPWWWLYSPSTLKAMLESCGFSVIDWQWEWDQRAAAFFCERTK